MMMEKKMRGIKSFHFKTIGFFIIYKKKKRKKEKRS